MHCLKCLVLICAGHGTLECGFLLENPVVEFETLQKRDGILRDDDWQVPIRANLSERLIDCGLVEHVDVGPVEVNVSVLQNGVDGPRVPIEPVAVELQLAGLGPQDAGLGPLGCHVLIARAAVRSHLSLY